MHRAILAALAVIALGGVAGCGPMGSGPTGYHEVAGVEENDMLKLRGGPGTGYSVIAGLPNGTVLWVNSCERTGGTRWCDVSLKQSPALKGYVSWTYLSKI